MLKSDGHVTITAVVGPVTAYTCFLFLAHSWQGLTLQVKPSGRGGSTVPFLEHTDQSNGKEDEQDVKIQMLTNLLRVLKDGDLDHWQSLTSLNPL